MALLMAQTQQYPITQRSIGAAVLSLFMTAMALPAQPLTTLATFNGTNGEAPQSYGTALVQGPDGDFYGTTSQSSGYGSVFKMTPTGTLTNLYTFCAAPMCADGANPYGGLTVGQDGNLYGTTSIQGANNSGTFFRVTPAGILTTLYSFTTEDTGANGVIQGKDGNFYGTTSSGGQYGHGSIFKLTASGQFTKLYSFGGVVDANSKILDGTQPLCSLVQGTNGNFYGTTHAGGLNGAGTIFSVTTAGVLTTLYTFGSVIDLSHRSIDGINPVGQLVQANDGNFYGVTSLGGPGAFGTIFQMTPDGTLTTLYSFCAGTLGCGNGERKFFSLLEGPTKPCPDRAQCPTEYQPSSGLVQASDGALYGTTLMGGVRNQGTLFKMTLDGSFTLIHMFANVPDGKRPFGALIQAIDGNLYGTTSAGGDPLSSSGTVFRLQPIGSDPTSIPTVSNRN